MQLCIGIEQFLPLCDNVNVKDYYMQMESAVDTLIEETVASLRVGVRHCFTLQNSYTRRLHFVWSTNVESNKIIVV